ncbi:Transposable element P transposase-like protein [Tribolium castaneum]|uniref:Transposable element P transposase-like protein n=1 Tax=Tribolium castaneum TaxID=7070 RepID=A0A139W9S9_TRICA|nr:Transposable element P transposase-like protein [Tribolium castaneum]
MLRGLFSNWKQPIFYDFDRKMDKDYLLNIINYVEQSALILWAWLAILVEEIDHFIKKINKTVIEELLEGTSASDLTIAHKISKENLYVKSAGRQKVKPATKLFSHTVSKAISRCGMNGQLKSENWMECAEFFKLVNDCQMTSVVKNLLVKGKKSLLPFQNGIIITNTSLPLLYEDLVARFDTKFILTYRLNQDVLENFFGAIRAKGGLHDHPDPIEFRYRLRSYILGRNEGSLSAYGNVEENNTP